MKSILFVCLSTLAFAVHSANVKSPMSPGLWELTSKVTSDDPKVQKAMEQAQQAMANMPPEQKKMMQEMMRKQGMVMASSANGETVSKICISQAMIDQQGLPTQQSGKCTQNFTQDGANYKFSYSCSAPKSSGEGTYTFSGPGSYSMAMTTTSGEGANAQRMRISGRGKLLGSDCGAIKPLQMSK
jgi:Protein of unknown function (DUF3617)